MIYWYAIGTAIWWSFIYYIYRKIDRKIFNVLTLKFENRKRA